MRSVVQGAMLVCAAVATGCGGAGEVTAPAGHVSSVGAEFSATEREDRGNGRGRDPVQSVTGSAFIVLPYEGSPAEHYTVAAIRHRDGSFSGEFNEFSDQEGGLRTKGTIYCFSIVGDTARIAGRIERSDASYGPAGSYVIWNVVDQDAHGRGGKQPRDMTTDFYFGGTQAQATAHCATNLLRGQPYFESDRGNIEVRD